MRRGKSAGIVAVFALSLLVVSACGDTQSSELRAAIAEGCAIDSECSSPLVCAFRACHVQCETSRDCEKYGKANCVQSDKPYRVCQLPTETTCKRNSECPGSQICGPDARCRDACLVDRDCGGGQLCISRVCAEKEELIGDKLPGAPPPAKGDVCLRPSDCGTDLVCKFGTCTVECVTAKDCDYGLTCIDTKCGLPNVGGAGGRAGSGGQAGQAGQAGKAGQGGAGGQAGLGGAAGQGGTGGQAGSAGAGGQAGAGGGTCIADAPCDTGNACEIGKTDCTTGVAACVSGSMRPAGTQCRAAAGVCDAPESCDGKTPTCPPDARKSAGTECRAAAGACDLAEVCDGAKADCPSDALRPASFACRASVGDCDSEELCTGADAACPADARVAAGSVCRASTGDCDAEETCDGTASACPDDGLRAAGFTCRAAASSCDVAEACSGASNSCPIDAFVGIGDACAGGFCDGAGTCSNTCTPNAPCSTGNPCELGKTDCTSGVPKCVATGPGNAGTVCRTAAGPCDVEDVCSGASTVCADGKLGAGATCRPSAGPCDPAETCDGSAVTCPDDAFDPPSKTCRPATGGGCDVAETCTGTTADCPADAFAPATKVCRTSAGFCDVAESCTGSSGTCPADAFQPATLECRASAGVCDVAEKCTGSTGSCPGDTLLGASTTCRAAAGECDVAEVCGAAGAACPGNGLKPVGTSCSTGQCDSIGVCAIEQDCTHRWRVATNINSNLTLNASDRTAVVAGFSPSGVRADALADVSGAVAWTRMNTGSFGGRASSRFVLYQNIGGGAQIMGVTDMWDGTPILGVTYSGLTNFYLSMSTSAVSQGGKAVLTSNAAFAAGAYSVDANGKTVSGTGPAGLLILHNETGAYVTHTQFASSNIILTPTPLYDGRWAVPVPAPGTPVTFGAHTTPAGSHELVILTASLAFDRFYPLSFAPSTMTVVPGTNLRVVSGGNATAAFNDAGAVWSRSDCGGTTIGASATQIIVTSTVGGSFCGRPVPAGLGAGMGVAVLDATTGATVSLRWFPTSISPWATSIGNDGDTYFLYPDGATVCGTNNPSITVLGY